MRVVPECQDASYLAAKTKRQYLAVEREKLNLAVAKGEMCRSPERPGSQNLAAPKSRLLLVEIGKLEIEAATIEGELPAQASVEAA
jgi:hypothetical protein